jgi:hypothetical protein
MKISKRQLKKIIREEYSRLKRRGLLKEANSAENAASDLSGVQSQYGAEMEFIARPGGESVAAAQELTPELQGLEYLGEAQDDEGYAAWVFWDGSNYQIASGSGASWDLYTCKDAVEAYLCIEMCSYHEPTLHPDALAFAGLQDNYDAYDWHDSLISKEFNLRTF